MTKLERRKLYYKMFKVYILGLFMSERWKLMHDINRGFCYYLGTKPSLYYLYELNAQKPETCDNYWFPQGHLRPRIKCLIKAIILTY